MKKSTQHKSWWLGVLVIGVVCIVLGIFQGDFQETLAKAVRVCYECIGIG